MFQHPIEFLMTVGFATCSVVAIYFLNRIFGSGKPDSLLSILTQLICYLPPNVLFWCCTIRVLWGGFAHLLNSVGL